MRATQILTGNVLFMVGHIILNERGNVIDIHIKDNGKLAIDSALCIIEQLLIGKGSAMLLAFLFCNARMHRLAHQKKRKKVVGTDKLAEMLLHQMRVRILVIVWLQVEYLIKRMQRLVLVYGMAQF